MAAPTETHTEKRAHTIKGLKVDLQPRPSTNSQQVRRRALSSSESGNEPHYTLLLTAKLLKELAYNENDLFPQHAVPTPPL